MSELPPSRPWGKTKLLVVENVPRMEKKKFKPGKYLLQTFVKIIAQSLKNIKGKTPNI